MAKLKSDSDNDSEQNIINVWKFMDNKWCFNNKECLE